MLRIILVAALFVSGAFSYAEESSQSSMYGYKIKSGDQLMFVSYIVFGSIRHYEKFLPDNPHIKNPNKIKPGSLVYFSELPESEKLAQRGKVVDRWKSKLGLPAIDSIEDRILSPGELPQRKLAGHGDIKEDSFKEPKEHRREKASPRIVLEAVKNEKIKKKSTEQNNAEVIVPSFEEEPEKAPQALEPPKWTFNKEEWKVKYSNAQEGEVRGLELVNTYEKKYQFDKIIPTLEGLNELYPQSPKLKISLGEKYEENNRAEDAESTYKAALKIDKKYILAHHRLLRLYSKQKKQNELDAQIGVISKDYPAALNLPLFQPFVQQPDLSSERQPAEGQ